MDASCCATLSLGELQWRGDGETIRRRFPGSRFVLTSGHHAWNPGTATRAFGVGHVLCKLDRTYNAPMTLSVFKGTDLGAVDWAKPGIDSVDFRGSDFQHPFETALPRLR
jgi:hypothetical protein